MGTVILVASGKGGTGKSMFSVNIGATFALREKSVVIVDMDMGLRNTDLYLGLENNVVYDAHDVMTGVCRIKQALIRDERFRDLCFMGASPTREMGEITPLHVKVLCEKLADMFDVVIVDAPAGIDDGLVVASAGADAVVILTTPEYASIRNADTLDKELVKLGIFKRYVVVNKIIPELMQAGYVPGLDKISGLLMPEIIGTILYDDNINISINLGIPIVLKPSTYIRRNFEMIAARLEERCLPEELL
ncbi:MAG: septum site-determining protein MinD [Eubacterium sp.]|nr:septum site-determining protein MinD [Eubacterium sp.]